MSVAIMGSVLDRGPAKGPERSLLVAIANNADDFGFACPGQDLLASACCCDERTIIRNCKRLESAGWMRVERKIFGGRGNAYFINIEKLGVVPNEKSRRSPLWADLQRLLKALNSGDKLSRKSGVLQFERPGKNGAATLIGNLFEDDLPGDKMSPEFEGAESEAEANINEIAASAGVLEAFEAKDGQIPGDKMSPVTRHQRHLTSDIHDRPFNSLTVTETVSEPPLRGGGDFPDQGKSKTAEPVLPDPGCRPGEMAWALNVGIAARWVLGECGISATASMARVVASQLALVVNEAKPLGDAAVLMVTAWEDYQRRVAAGQLRFQWGAAAFFGEGYWGRTTSWPWKDVPAAKEAGRVQHNPDAAAKQQAAEMEAHLVTAEARAAQLEAKGGFDCVVRGLRELRSTLPAGFDVRDLERELTRLEDEMIAVLQERSAEAREAIAAAESARRWEHLGLTPKAQQQYRAEHIARDVTAACDVPRLTIFYRMTLS